VRVRVPYDSEDKLRFHGVPEEVNGDVITAVRSGTMR